MPHRVASLLLPLGLARTLIATPKDQGFSVARVNSKRTELDLIPLGTVECSRATVIGRVGPPDPRLGMRWYNSLTFYGKRFDAFSKEDPNCTLRRRIAAAPLWKNLSQVTRDDQFALTGSYYSVFREILQSRRGLPLVLFAQDRLNLDSLPVLLLNLRNPRLAERFADLARRLLTPEEPAPGPVLPVVADGIEVGDVSPEDVEKYF